MTSDMRS